VEHWAFPSYKEKTKIQKNKNEFYILYYKNIKYESRKIIIISRTWLSTEIKNNKEPIEYICKCGEIKKKKFSDFKRRGCRTCNSKNLTIKQEDIDYIDDENNSEIWKPVNGGWISSLGRAKNNNGVLLKLCQTKYRYYINGKNQYASRLVAEAFQIQGYENLNNSKYAVTHKDKNLSNNKVENLEIIGKDIISSINGMKSRKSEKFLNEERKFEDMKDNEYKILNEFSDYTIFKNGEIWNGKRFLTFSKSEKYLSVNIYKTSFKVHRLICYAFNPLPDKKCYEDYRDLQVNHKDGNTLNNNAENLEWCNNSENQKHAYTTGLKKNVKSVVQLDKEGNEIARYKSVAEASRASGEPSHRISAIMRGGVNGKATFNWKLEIKEVEIKRINNFK